MAENEDLNPTEWVGYEPNGVKRNAVFVQVACSLPAAAKYKIYCSEDDYEGEKVSVSSLFKFGSYGKDSEGHRISKESGCHSLSEGTTENEFPSTSYNKDSKQRWIGQGRERFAPATILYELSSKPDMEEGKRYILQAKEDLKMAKLISTELKGHYLSCFLSHQVAEKALGGLFLSHYGSFEGKASNVWHDLKARLGHVNKIISEEELTESVEILNKYYLPTRYPDEWKDTALIPAQCFDEMQAKQAIKCAEFILEHCNISFRKK